MNYSMNAGLRLLLIILKAAPHLINVKAVEYALNNAMRSAAKKLIDKLKNWATGDKQDLEKSLDDFAKEAEKRRPERMR